ncbi:hypothetical protein Hdeb2414_s0009g00303181 [Helianthus debilis subsp. tardiflorus]
MEVLRRTVGADDGVTGNRSGDSDFSSVQIRVSRRSGLGSGFRRRVERCVQKKCNVPSASESVIV